MGAAALGLLVALTASPAGVPPLPGPAPALPPQAPGPVEEAPTVLEVRAEAPEVQKEAEPRGEAEEVRNWGNLRIGGAVGGGDGRPEICGEVTPLEFLSVEGCGTGAGIFHDEPVHEASHYRVKVRLLRLRHDDLVLEPVAGAGMIEIQVGKDDAGFRFGDTGPRGVETAGFEVMGGLRGMLPVGAGFELVAEFSLGLGYVPHAPDLVVPQSEVPVFAALTVGAGF